MGKSRDYAAADTAAAIASHFFKPPAHEWARSWHEKLPGIP